MRELAILNAIGEVLNREPDLSVALHQAVERLVDVVGVRTGWIFLSRSIDGDPHFGGFQPAAMVGLPPALSAGGCAALREGSCECEGMFRRGELDFGINVVTCSRLENAEGDRDGLQIHASVPLHGREAPVGILNLASPGDDRFDDEALTLLDAVGRQIGVAYERAVLLHQRQQDAEHRAAREARDRIARDAHDSVSQLLFGADLSLKVARGSPDAAKRDAAVQRAADLVESSLMELRGLVELWRSADLRQGLVAALERLVERTTGTMKVSLRAEDVELPEDVQEVLYRCAQEAVHNAMKHSWADNVWIQLSGSSRAVRLRVDDDGEGLPAELAPGVGLLSMRARAVSVGGKVRVVNRRPHGTRLEVVLPWASGS